MVINLKLIRYLQFSKLLNYYRLKFIAIYNHFAQAKPVYDLLRFYWSSVNKSSTLFAEKHERQPNQKDRYLLLWFQIYIYIFKIKSIWLRIQFKLILKQVVFTIFLSNATYVPHFQDLMTQRRIEIWLRSHGNF